MKCNFNSRHLFPQFSILDPETTMSLPTRQTANGVVDSFIHVCEQYLTVCLRRKWSELVELVELVVLVVLVERKKAREKDGVIE